MNRSDRPILTSISASPGPVRRLRTSLCLTIVAVAVLTATLSACGSPAAPVALATPTTSTEASINVSEAVIASATIVPAKISEMGFIISAPVKEVAVKEGDKVQAGQTLVVLNTPDLEYSIVGAEAVLRSAQAEAEIQRFRNKTRNQAGKVVYLSGPRELIEIADAKVQQAQSALVFAQASLAQGSLLAPYDGTIVQLNVTPGEFVQLGQVVAIMGDLDQLQVETTDLSERDISAVELGQDAIVYVEALDAEFDGKVTAISPVADIIGGDVVYKVTVTFDEKPKGLLWGMNAEVNIITE